MIILDWKANKDYAMMNGIKLDTSILLPDATPRLNNKDGFFSDTMFRNFPHLDIECMKLERCAFEECGEVLFHDSCIKDCHFLRVEVFSLDNTEVVDSEFSQLHGNCEFIIQMEDSSFSHSRFSDIELGNDAYFCDAVGHSFVESCDFKNIRTTRKDFELFHCEETVGKLFKRKKEFDIVDRDSCTGLDSIVGQGD